MSNPTEENWEEMANVPFTEEELAEGRSWINRLIPKGYDGATVQSVGAVCQWFATVDSLKAENAALKAELARFHFSMGACSRCGQAVYHKVEWVLGG